MTPIEYLQSLIAGQKISSIPVHVTELEFLLALMQAERQFGADQEYNNA